MTPLEVGDAEVERLWLESGHAEAFGRSRVAAALREKIVPLLPDNVHNHWRIARDYVRVGETLSADDPESRLEIYQKALAAARRGREIDASCGECCFYEFASLGRIVTTQGVLRSFRTLRKASQVLEECLELPPAWSDAPWAHERGNLYLGAAGFYRMVPESRMAALVTGARGDVKRAVEYARKAVEIAPGRIDYHVELGASLLCLGTRRDDEEAVELGRAVLGRIPALLNHLPRDPDSRVHAVELAEQPERACRYSRDTWTSLED